MFFSFRAGGYLRRIPERYGIENSFKIVIAVWPFARDTQAEVDLAIRKKDQLFINGIFFCC